MYQKKLIQPPPLPKKKSILNQKLGNYILIPNLKVSLVSTQLKQINYINICIYHA